MVKPLGAAVTAPQKKLAREFGWNRYPENIQRKVSSDDEESLIIPTLEQCTSVMAAVSWLCLWRGFLGCSRTFCALLLLPYLRLLWHWALREWAAAVALILCSLDNVINQRWCWDTFAILMNLFFIMGSDPLRNNHLAFQYPAFKPSFPIIETV